MIKTYNPKYAILFENEDEFGNVTIQNQWSDVDLDAVEFLNETGLE